MADFTLLTDEQITKSLAERFEQLRLQNNLTEAEVSNIGGATKDAMHRFKQGKGISLTNFIKLLRGIDKLDALEQLLVVPQSLSQIKEPNKKRVKKKNKVTKSEFLWGEDS